MSSPEAPHPNSILSRTEDDLPIAKSWWFHSSPLSLDDPLAPLPKSALDEGTWKPFSEIDCTALEEKWNGLPESIKRKEERLPNENAGVDELALQNTDGNGDDGNAKQVDDVSQDDAKVIVGIERLHPVDLATQRLPRTLFKAEGRLGPIYWHPLNSFLDSASVLRSVWFNAESFTPVEPSLSRSLEEGYISLRAWSSTYVDELSSALSLGLEAEDKLRWKVREDPQGREIFFINSFEAWIVPAIGVVQGLFGRSQVLKGVVERGKGGVKVIRGYDNVTKKLKQNEKKPIHYTDLIFVIHGIGQKLSERGISPLCITSNLKWSHSRLLMQSTASVPISTTNAKMNILQTTSDETIIPVSSQSTGAHVFHSTLTVPLVLSLVRHSPECRHPPQE